MRARLAGFVHRIWAGKGWISTLLLPLSWLTERIVRQRRLRYLRHPDRVTQGRVPVVVVGNLFVGGTGKTPVVLAVVRALQESGWRPGVISRGYGVAADAAPRLGQGGLDPALFGDEPTLIAAETGVPVAVHPRRVEALKTLQDRHPDVDVVVADDGLQHLALGRQVEIVVQDERGLGNGRLLPAGPLREPASRLETVDVLISHVTAPGPEHVRAEWFEAASTAHPARASGAAQATQARHVSPSAPAPRIVCMTLVPDTVRHLASGRILAWDEWRRTHAGTPVSAVAAIGNPERFFRMLRLAGTPLGSTIALPDHDDYRRPPFGGMPDAPILMTPKDAVKCASLEDPRLWEVRPRTVFSDPDWLQWLHERLLPYRRPAP